MESLSSKMTHGEAGKLGYLASLATQIKLKEERINKYNLSPNKCKTCGNILEYKKRKNMYCSHSCAALFNNKGVRRHGKETSCLYCKKLTKASSRRFCSQECYHNYQRAINNNDGYITENISNIVCQCGTIIKNTKSKFCSNQCFQNNKLQKKYERMKNENIKIIAHSLRVVLLYARGHKCEICKRTEWENHTIPVVIDHIDGDHNNNKVDNLRVICCNCDALLPTYKGRNKGNGRAYRRERYKAGKTY